MQVVINKEGSVTIVKPMGPIVMEEFDEMDEVLAKLEDKWSKRIVVNMSNVTFLDSAGLEMISRHGRQMINHGLTMKLCNLNETSQTIFDLTRIARQFEIYPDASSAIRSFL